MSTAEEDCLATFPSLDHTENGSGNAERVRILHVIPRLGRGGAERVLCTLMRGQRKLGLDPRLCVLGSENAFPDRLRELPEPEFLGASLSRRDILGNWRCVRRLRDLIDYQAVQIVHSHLWPAARIAAMACLWRPVRHVVHVHDTRPWLAGTALRDRITRRLSWLTLRYRRPQFVAVSDATRAYTCRYLRWVPNDIPVVFNGVDQDEFAAPPVEKFVKQKDVNNSLVLGAVGRYAPEKGHESLFRAVHTLRRRGIELKLRVAGEGSLRESYEAFLTAAGLRDLVELCGPIADMDGFYRSIDLFVLPSLSMEGFPMTIVEAMFYGLPIVATSVPGPPEALRHGIEGLIVPPGDDQALAKAIDELVSDPKRRQAMGYAAQQRVTTEFTSRRMVEDFCRIYENLGS